MKWLDIHSISAKDVLDSSLNPNRKLVAEGVSFIPGNGGAIMSKTKPIHVLIVDDEERFLKTATATLERRGFEVTAANSGPKALDLIRKGDIDVVVLDVKMPQMNGNEVLHEIKIINPNIEVIMLTGHGTLRSALIALRDHVYEYLTKPCDMETLAETIRNAFQKKRDPLHDAEWYSIWSKGNPGME